MKPSTILGVAEAMIGLAILGAALAGVFERDGPAVVLGGIAVLCGLFVAFGPDGAAT
jgi:hypothetical protein